MGKRQTNVIHTADPKMREILEAVDNFASSRASVLIIGESGTGKELLARYVHSKSPRSSERMVTVNCAAVPEGLLESELFGHEKGAFTGAIQQKIGKFELAHNSTFLLDEVTEMSLPLQTKLLRVLQEGEIERVGGTAPISINVRIISTTNRNIETTVKEGGFREDLFYRLNVIPLFVPPLRSRPKDIEMLSQVFLQMSCEENGLPLRELSSGAQRRLLGWSWPGNVRELQNTIERTVLMCQSDVIQEDDLQINDSQELDKRSLPDLRAGMTVSEAEKLLIEKTLEFTEQNRTQAADMLGISIRTLRNKLNLYRRMEAR